MSKTAQMQTALAEQADKYRPRWTYKAGDEVRVLSSDLSGGAAWKCDGEWRSPAVGSVLRVKRTMEYGGGVEVELPGYYVPWFTQAVFEREIRPAILSRQDIFDIAAHHMVFVLRGNAALDPDNGACMYESADGRQCAVGALVPSQAGRKVMNTCGPVGTTYDAVDTTHGNLRTILEGAGVPMSLPPTVDLLRELQRIHDAGDYTKPLTPGRRLHIWKRSLRRLAVRSGLVVPEYLQAK